VNNSQLPKQDEDPDDYIRGEDNDIETEEMISSAPVEEWNGKFRVFLDIPSELYGHLIGKRGASLHMVQDQTDCKVTVPRGARHKAAPVEVVGNQRRAVVRASNMLMMAADRGRMKMPPSHFVTVRLCTQHVQNRLTTFKAEALELGGRGVVPGLFQDARRLHLTLAVLTLLTEEERQTACRALQEHADQLRGLLPASGLSLRLRNLDIMNDDASETRVLFARVHEPDGGGAMQQLADRCYDLVVGTGLGRREHDSVKLHCTLMNASFLVRELDESDPRHREGRNATFDSANIMRELGKFDFGTVPVHELEVVQRYTTGEDGFYRPIGAVSLAQA